MNNNFTLLKNNVVRNRKNFIIHFHPSIPILSTFYHRLCLNTNLKHFYEEELLRKAHVCYNKIMNLS